VNALARFVLVLAVLSIPRAAAADEALWTLLKGGGQVVIMRHAATVPNVPDTLGPRGCANQRNLSEAGREDARRIGAAFRARGITVEDVRASVWCRCMDTARLAFGSVINWPALDSFLRDRRREGPQTQEVRELVSRHRGGTLVLVTHQVNITALTGLFPAEGEMLILTPSGDNFTVAGRLKPSDVSAN
jgi:broad specificity phosphatase PhoE